MKALNHLLMAAAAVVSLNLTAQAVEPALSPKATQLRHDFRKVLSAPNEADLTKDRPMGNAKASSLAWDFRKVPGTGPEMNLAHAPRPMLSPKDPGYEMLVRKNALRQYQLAESIAAK